MRLLFLLDAPPLRMTAPSSRFIELGRLLQRRGHSVRVVGSRTEKREPDAEIEVIQLPHEADGGWRQAVYPFRAALAPHLAWCDALIVRGYWIALWAMFRAGRRPIRLYDFHGLTYREQIPQRCWRGALLSWAAESAALRLCNGVLAASAGFIEVLPRKLRGKVLLLENGVTWPPSPDEMPPPSRDRLCRAWNIPADRPILVALARFGPQLDVWTLMQAASRWGDLATLVLIGDGPSLEQARERAAAFDLSRVFFVGRKPHDESMRFLRYAVDACVCPYSGQWPQSRIPGFYGIRKVKEYLAAGRPILVASVPACESFLVQEENCLRYKPDDPDDLIEQTRRLLSEADLLQRLSAAALATASHYSWASVLERSGLPEWLDRERST